MYFTNYENACCSMNLFERNTEQWFGAFLKFWRSPFKLGAMWSAKTFWRKSRWGAWCDLHFELLGLSWTHSHRSLVPKKLRYDNSTKINKKTSEFPIVTHVFFNFWFVLFCWNAAVFSIIRLSFYHHRWKSKSKADILHIAILVVKSLCQFQIRIVVNFSIVFA